MIEIIEKSRLIKMEKVMKRGVLLVLCGICWLVGICQISLGQKPELYVQTGHSSEVTSLRISTDGRLLISLGSNEIKIWDIFTRKELRTLKTTFSSMADRVNEIAISPNNIEIASSNTDKTIIFWDLISGEKKRQIKESSLVNSIAFSSEGNLLATGCDDKTIGLWDVKSGQKIKTIQGHSDKVSALSFSPDKKIIASGSSDKTIKLWNVETGKEILTFHGHSEHISDLVFSPEGKKIISYGSDKTVRVWDIETGEEIFTLQHNSAWVTSIAVSPNGTRLITAGYYDSLKTWDLVSGKELKNLKLKAKGEILSVVFSANGNEVFGGSSEGEIKAWNVETGAELFSFQSSRGVIESVSFSSNVKFLATGNERGEVKLWSLVDGKEVKTLIGHSTWVRRILFSPDGKLLATRDSNSVIILWDIESGQKIKQFKGLGSDYDAIAFSPDTRYLSWVENINEVKVLIIQTGQEFPLLGGTQGGINSLAFSPDGNNIAGGNRDGVIKLWDIKTGKEINSFKGYRGSVVKVAFSQNGKFLAGGCTDNVFIVWDLLTGKKFKEFNSSNEPLSVDFSPDSKILAGLDWKAELKFWDLESGNEKTLRDVSPTWVFFDNTILASVSIIQINNTPILVKSDGKSIQLINLITYETIITLNVIDEKDWIVTTPEGFFDGTPNAWKQLIWRFNNNTFDYGAVELYFNDFFYPNLLQDVLAGKSPQAKAGSELEKIDRRQPKVEIVSINGQTKEQFTAQTVNQNRTARVLVEVTENVSEKKQANHEAASGAQDLRLSRNGSLVKHWKGNVFDKSSGCEAVQTKREEARRVRCAVEVPIVAGENNFSAYAFNLQNVKSEDDTVSVKGAETLKKDGTLYVLAVGVDRYAKNSVAGNLNYAVKDVEVMSAKIHDEQKKLQNNPSLKQYAKTEIITLKDETATKDNFLLALEKFAKGDAQNPSNLCANLGENLCAKLKSELSKIKPTQPEDALLIYFAGHGTSKEQRFYLLTHNFTDANQLEKQAVSDIELNQYLEKVDAGKLLMVIDACQSGQALGAKEEGRAPMNSKGLAQLAYDKGMLILTAAQSYQAALEAPRIGERKIEHGLLTFALLEAFSNKEADKDANRQIWEREWFDFAVSQVPLLQREAMKQREIDLKNKTADVQGRSGIYYVNGDKNADAEQRSVQTPRVFYRREPEIKPFILANP